MTTGLLSDRLFFTGRTLSAIVPGVPLGFSKSVTYLEIGYFRSLLNIESEISLNLLAVYMVFSIAGRLTMPVSFIKLKALPIFAPPIPSLSEMFL